MHCTLLTPLSLHHMDNVQRGIPSVISVYLFRSLPNAVPKNIFFSWNPKMCRAAAVTVVELWVYSNAEAKPPLSYTSFPLWCTNQKINDDSIPTRLRGKPGTSLSKLQPTVKRATSPSRSQPGAARLPHSAVKGEWHLHLSDASSPRLSSPVHDFQSLPPPNGSVGS